MMFHIPQDDLRDDLRDAKKGCEFPEITKKHIMSKHHHKMIDDMFGMYRKDLISHHNDNTVSKHHR